MDDLTTRQGIERLMSSSDSHEEWLMNFNRVKRANNWDFVEGPHWIIEPLLYTTPKYIDRFFNRQHIP